MSSGSDKSEAAVADAVNEACAGGVDGNQLASDLFAIVGLLDGELMLRRALTEPSVPLEAKTLMLHSLLDGKVDEPALSVVETAVGRRWSRGSALADVVERAAVTAVAATADEAGELDGLEDDLFRFGRILESETALREALGDAAAPVQSKRDLLHTLLSGQAGQPTQDLLDQLVVGRHRSLLAGLAYYQTVAAARRQGVVATAWVAAPLSDERKQRLTDALAKQYSRQVHLNVVVDPEVLGGVRIEIGDDRIDSTIETRLAEAHRQLVT